MAEHLSASPTLIRKRGAVPTGLATTGFSFADEPPVNSKDELSAATSGSHNLRRRSNCNPCACSSHLAQLDHDVGAGLVPALRQGAQEGRPYTRRGTGILPVMFMARMAMARTPCASWFGGNGHGGDGKPSPLRRKALRTSGAGRWDLHAQ